MKPEEKAREKIGKLSNSLPNEVRIYFIMGLPCEMNVYLFHRGQLPTPKRGPKKR